MKTETLNTFTGSFKRVFTKVVMAATLAGAVFFATAKPAAAQGFSVHLGFGHPYYGHRYYGPVYAPPVYAGPVYAGPVYGPGFYAERRHDLWVREHEFRYRRPAYGYYGR